MHSVPRWRGGRRCKGCERYTRAVKRNQFPGRNRLCNKTTLKEHLQKVISYLVLCCHSHGRIIAAGYIPQSRNDFSFKHYDHLQSIIYSRIQSSYSLLIALRRSLVLPSEIRESTAVVVIQDFHHLYVTLCTCVVCCVLSARQHPVRSS